MDERIVELEEIVKNKEIFLAQAKYDKQEEKKIVDKMNMKINGRPI
jgi:hypothetical protein